MSHAHRSSTLLRIVTGTLLVFGVAAAPARATEPCGDFGECKVLVEINATDGDIGFHFLMDGDDLRKAGILDPQMKQVFTDKAFGPLRDQGLTETFAESAEPLCWDDPEADPDEEIVALDEFLARWTPGWYSFYGFSDGGELQHGTSPLTFELPAAPEDVDFDGDTISWSAGEDLGRCANAEELTALVAAGVLPMHPRDVPVAAWEVVLEPDVEDGDPVGNLVYTMRLPGGLWPLEVSVPPEYLGALPQDTPVKVEVLAIGADDNATASEEDGFCANEAEGCEED